MRSGLKVAALVAAGSTLIGAMTTTADAQRWGGGWRGGGWHGGWGGGWRRGGGWGGFGAGLIGGLALGAIVAPALAGPYYGGYGGYGGPYYGAGYYGGGYYGSPIYAAGYGWGGDCFIRRSVRYTPWGPVVRRVRVCY